MDRALVVVFHKLQERETAADYPFFSSLLELKLESLDDVEVQEVLDYIPGHRT